MRLKTSLNLIVPAILCLAPMFTLAGQTSTEKVLNNAKAAADFSTQEERYLADQKKLENDPSSTPHEKASGCMRIYDFYVKASQAQKAQDFLNRAVSYWQAADNSIKPKAAASLDAKARSQTSVAEYNQLFAAAESILKSTQSKDKLQLAVMYVYWARKLFKDDQLPAAEKVYEQSITIYKASGNDYDPNFAIALREAGQCLKDLSRYTNA